MPGGTIPIALRTRALRLRIVNRLEQTGFPVDAVEGGHGRGEESVSQ